MNIADWLLETGAPGEIALIEPAGRHTYAGLREAVAELVDALADLGLAPGTRVGLLAPNSLFWVAGYLAVLHQGLVAVPLPDKLRPEEVQRNATLAGCAAVLADRRTLRRSGAGLGRLLTVTDEVLSRVPEAAVAGGTAPSGRPSPVLNPGVDVPPGADAVLMFTSGSTAEPKAVRVTHRNLQANTESILAFLPLQAGDRALVILPFFYCYGASLLHTHLRRGASMVLLNSFVFPELALDAIQSEQCTVFAGVPSSFHLLLRAGRYADRPLPSLRIVQAAGGRLEPTTVDALRRAQPGADLFLMYGQTEATARLSYLPPEELGQRPGSIGRGIPGVELRVLDDGGRPVPPGVPGEIYARGENISPGYDGDPEASAATFTPRGLRTGDLAVVDQEGWITVVGRRDDFIKSWGYRVSSHEVEACARRMPGVGSAAVVGVPDEAAGEAVTLFVTPDDAAVLARETVLAFCAQHLPRHMVPRTVIVLGDLPLNGSGKVAKPVLRDLALARS